MKLPPHIEELLLSSSSGLDDLDQQ